MQTVSKAAGIAGLSLAVFSFSASALPTQEEVDAARGECHQHKLRVKELEATMPHEEVASSQEHEAWVAACTRAHYLMEELEPEYKPTTFSEGTHGPDESG